METKNQQLNAIETRSKDELVFVTSIFGTMIYGPTLNLKRQIALLKMLIEFLEKI